VGRLSFTWVSSWPQNGQRIRKQGQRLCLWTPPGRAALDRHLARLFS